MDALQKAAGDQNQIAERLPAAAIALPQPLRWYLGRRSQELDRDLEQEISDGPLDFVHGPQCMAFNGFHPGPPTYTLWGKSVAEVILRNMTKHANLSHGMPGD